MHAQRSNFTALDDGRRRRVRETALTMAQQGLRRRGAPNTLPIARRSADGHQPGNQAGTYNSSSTAGGTAGTTDGNTGGGIELMARVILNQSKGTKPDKPHPASTQKAPPWPKSSGGAKVQPMMPRRG